jgi:hypothetical protein
MKGTSYASPQYMAFSNLLSLRLFLVQIFALAPFSYTLSRCSSLNIRDQVLHSYRTTAKTVVLYILTSTVLDSRREDKRFWTEWYQALPEFNLLLICSYIKFLFVSTVPKYLNCVTFSRSDCYSYVMILACILVMK